MLKADKICLETMIYEVGSEVITHKPESDVEYVDELKDENEKTPRQQESKAATEGPYETPVVLRTRPWAPPVAIPDDTEADDSEAERIFIRKRKKPTKASSTLLMKR